MTESLPMGADVSYEETGMVLKDGELPLPEEIREDEIVPADVVRGRVSYLIGVRNTVDLELGGWLYRILHNRLYEEWGYESFEDYTKSEMDWKYRKATYFISMWKKFRLELGVSDDEIKGIPWTKLRAVDSVITADNKDDLLPKVRESTVVECEAIAKSLKATDEDGTAPPVEDSKIFNCMLMGEQIENVELAFENAGRMAKSDKKGHLLDQICLAFNASVGVDSTSLPVLLKHIQDRFGVRLIAVEEGKEDVIAEAECVETES